MISRWKPNAREFPLTIIAAWMQNSIAAPLKGKTIALLQCIEIFVSFREACVALDLINIRVSLGG